MPLLSYFFRKFLSFAVTSCHFDIVTMKYFSAGKQKKSIFLLCYILYSKLLAARASMAKNNYFALWGISRLYGKDFGLSPGSSSMFALVKIRLRPKHLSSK